MRSVFIKIPAGLRNMQVPRSNWSATMASESGESARAYENNTDENTGFGSIAASEFESIAARVDCCQGLFESSFLAHGCQGDAGVGEGQTIGQAGDTLKESSPASNLAHAAAQRRQALDGGECTKGVRVREHDGAGVVAEHSQGDLGALCWVATTANATSPRQDHTGPCCQSPSNSRSNAECVTKGDGHQHTIGRCQLQVRRGRRPHVFKRLRVGERLGGVKETQGPRRVRSSHWHVTVRIR